MFGMNYDQPASSAPGSTTHEPFDPEVVGGDMRVPSAEELCCDAVRVSGGVQERIEIARPAWPPGRVEVWYCPFTTILEPRTL